MRTIEINIQEDEIHGTVDETHKFTFRKMENRSKKTFPFGLFKGHAKEYSNAAYLEIYQEEQRVLYWELEDFQDKDSLVFTREGLLEEGEWKPEELTLEGLRVEFYEPKL